MDEMLTCQHESLGPMSTGCRLYNTGFMCFPAFPAYYGVKARFTNISPPKCTHGSESISGYHPNHTRKREAISWAARSVGGMGGYGAGRGRGLVGGTSSPLAGLREARHAPQRKSLSLIVRTKSETIAAPSISLSWHYRWRYSRVWLCADVHALVCVCVVLCCVEVERKKWGSGGGGDEES